jgi:transcriptional regulator with XRE-family HTH domain
MANNATRLAWMTIKTLGDFVLREIQNRQMSQREFARFVGVNHQTINKLLDYGEKEDTYPALDSLVKLAKATNTDICTLIALITPDVVSQPDPEAEMIAERISKLPPNKRDAIDALILGMALGGNQDSEQD